MTTPDRSVEEIAREYVETWCGKQPPQVFYEQVEALTQTLQAERQKRHEVVERIKMTADDVWKVGDHYWAGDYEPSHYELMMLAESYNDIMKRKLTQPNNLK